MHKLLVKLALNLHSFSYKLASVLAIKAEGGLHPKHRLMNYHAFFVDRILSTDRVLDIGCGNGTLAYDIAKKAKEVIAIDLNPSNIETAKKKFLRENIKYRVADATKDLDNETFEVIVLSNVLEHIESRSDFLKRIRTLTPKILIRVPMIDRDWLTLYKKELGVEWRLDPTHFIEYTEETLKSELSEGGWETKEIMVRFGEMWLVVEHE